MHFNSQPRKGADWISTETTSVMVYFNSQPRKGADESRDASLSTATKNFNSQPHKGADGYVIDTGNWENVFQLTAPQGG